MDDVLVSFMSRKMIFSGPSALAALLTLVLCLWSAPGIAQDQKVSTPDELRQALASSTGGIILLAPGDYGDLQLSKRRYDTPVVLKSEVPRRAVFNEILLADSANLQFIDLATHSKFRVDRSTDLVISGCQIGNMLYFRKVKRLKVAHCDVTGERFGVLFNTVSDFEIRHSQIGGVTEDVMRITGDSRRGLVEYNILADTIAQRPTHPDMIQTFSADGGTPSDITIRANLIYDDPETGGVVAQGIFMAGGGTSGYRNILLEQNLLYTGSANTIFIGGGQEKVIIRNNTLIPTKADGGAIIRLSGFKGFNNSGTMVSGNIAKLLKDETQKSKIQRNYFFGRNAALARLFSGRGDRWQDFLPAAGSAAEKSGMGAREFLQELADGRARLGPDWLEN
ncbi:right-handed parallel beta-helix repeat-containing protein [Neotabrizicola sp. sgz301269]|uniref:right-handed parallel beta-helix repeat-containing protein n=1 Tax=Neotabrizicola sp. sgz301269 TaxID=3276282 RepID=UPI00376F5EA4